jgi:hypothetical protein
MEAAIVSLQPVLPEDDVLLERFTQHQAKLLQSIVERLRGRIDTGVLEKLSTWLHIFRSLPEEARKRILVNPYFNQWIFQLVQSYRAGRRVQIEA